MINDVKLQPSVANQKTTNPTISKPVVASSLTSTGAQGGEATADLVAMSGTGQVLQELLNSSSPTEDTAKITAIQNKIASGQQSFDYRAIAAKILNIPGEN